MLQVILVAVCVAGLSQDCGPKGMTPDMVSGGAGEAEPDRLDPCKVLPWPKPIDIENDILLPQFSDKWFAELRGALQSRFLLTTEGTCKEHMSHAAPDKCREKAEAENELNRASEAIEHEVNTHCMVHPNAENRGVCLGGGVCGCGVHSRSVGLCRPLIGELPVGRPATVQ